MRVIVVFAALLGLTAVALGAAANHLFEANLVPQQLEQFTTALRYQQWYAAILLALGLFGWQCKTNKLFNLSCYLFLIGILIFSGSLYLALFLAMPMLNYGTPCGGLLLMLAWILLFAFALSHKQKT